MNNIKITEAIVKELSNLTYMSRNAFELKIISDKNLPIVENTILAILNNKIDSRLAELEAKVKVYEEVISKSNFKPFSLEESHE